MLIEKSHALHSRSNEAMITINNSYAVIDPDVEKIDDSQLVPLIL